jgi:hypothetical protein
MSNLRYTDDTTLIATSKTELLEMIAAVKDTSCPKGLPLNVKKTKIMVVDSNRTDRSDFLLAGEKIDVVEEFIYLGSLINIDGSSKKCGEDWRWLAQLCRVWPQYGKAEASVPL